MLRRFHIFEFGDQPWLSGWVREAYMDCLGAIHRTNQPYYHLAASIAGWAKAAHATKILDLGAGSAEHVAMLLQTCKKLGVSAPQFVLSDLYPDIPAYERLQKELGSDAIGYIAPPVSAFDMKNVGMRYWLISAAFHHFSPKNARQFLQRFSFEADGLCILEIQERSIFRLITMIFALPSYFIVPFLARRFQFRKLLFTTLIPIIPLLVMFDGIVSVLRTYTKEEIMALMPPGSGDTFIMEYREVKWPFLPFKSTMVAFTRRK